MLNGILEKCHLGGVKQENLKLTWAAARLQIRAHSRLKWQFYGFSFSGSWLTTVYVLPGYGPESGTVRRIGKANYIMNTVLGT